MINNSATAIQTHQYRGLGNGVFVLEPICRCYVVEPNTAGTIYCPLHGEMHKSNGVIKPVNGKRFLFNQRLYELTCKGLQDIQEGRVHKIPNIRAVKEA